MIGTEGTTDSGKTEFILSCPGPGLIICLDRGFDASMDNPNPPVWRRKDFGLNIVTAPKETQSLDPKFFAPYWEAFYKRFLAALANAEALTVAIDGDSDSWELQKLAEFGRLTNVFPQTKYHPVYAARKAMYARAWDSGKIIIGTNKVRDEYKPVYMADGTTPVLDEKGEHKREKTGLKERQGFPDQDYLWHIQIRHLRVPGGVTKKGVAFGPRWGLRILKCKAQPGLEGEELWDDDCNFKGLVQLVYPQVPLSEWGL
jgi:hypothetical protein